ASGPQGRGRSRMTHSRAAALAAGSALLSALFLIAASVASGSGKERGVRLSSASTPIPERDHARDCRFNAEVISIPMPPPLLAQAPVGNGEHGDGGVAGSCPDEISTWTSSDFGPGTYILQGGMAQGEIAAVSFTLPADKFPLQIKLTEMIFG